MHRAYFKLTLESDVIFRSASATTGMPEGLAYIPGAALLGAAARGYDGYDPMSAFTLFHSGKVRFGNGLPLSPSGHMAFPAPLCWHRDKYGQSIADNQQLQADRIFDRLVDQGSHEKLERLSSGYVTAIGEWVQPKYIATMKTAIDSDTGRAKDGQLFGYHALAAGQIFLARVEADSSVSLDLFKRIVENLCGILRLGKSRTAEFGRVQSEQQLSLVSPHLHGEVIDRQELTLWLLSDLVALDPCGMPTLAPKAEWLGLPPGQLNPKKTFIRPHAYAPYNTHRRHADWERACILAGSILHFTLEQPLDESHKLVLERGLGVCLESGLGQVLANPPLLGNKPVRFMDVEPSILPVEATATVPEQHPLVQWLERRVNIGKSQVESALEAEKARCHLEHLYRSARSLKGVPKAVAVGPGRSQWSHIMALAKKAGDEKSLAQALFGTGDDRAGKKDLGLCCEQAGGQGWMEETSLAGNMTTFREWFHKVFQEVRGKHGFVVELARRAMDVAREENGV